MYQPSANVLLPLRQKRSDVSRMLPSANGKRDRDRIVKGPIRSIPPDRATPVSIPILPQIFSSAPKVKQDNRPFTLVTIYGKKYRTLIDSGSMLSYVNEEVAREWRLKGARPKTPRASHTQVADGNTVSLSAEFHVRCQFGGKWNQADFLCLPTLTTPVLLGMDVLRKWRAQLDGATGQITLQPQTCRRRLGSQKPLALEASQIADGACHGHGLFSLGEASSEMAMVSCEAPVSQEAKLQDFLRNELPKYRSVPRRTHLVNHHIRLKNPTAPPIKQRYQPRNPKIQAIINAEVDKMLAAGVIEPSTSPWSSPTVIVRKKDGRPRFCIDFRLLNDATVKDAYPLPYISAILDKLRRAKYFFTIELQDGYWQVPLTEESRPLTALCGAYRKCGPI